MGFMGCQLARGHFVVRRLETLHGYDAVRRAYESLDGTTRGRRARPEGATV